MQKIPVTVAIPVKNEEINLPSCLARLGRFARVIVIDSVSEDRTVEIAEQAGATAVQFDWNGKFPKKRNWFLETCPIDTDWVLFLDADELISDAFCDELERTLATTPHHGFWLNYTNYFLGKPMHHGVAQRKLALFRVGAIRYERIDEDGWSGLDMEIHEHPIVGGTVGEITCRIDHDDDRGLPKFLDRHRHYAMWEARRYAALREGSGDQSHFSPRQRKKYAHLGKWWFPWAYFVQTYLLKRGFLDGRAGFLLAFYKLWYFVSIGALIGEAEAQPKPTGAASPDPSAAR